MTQETDQENLQILLDLKDEDAVAAATTLGIDLSGESASFLVAINSASGEISSTRLVAVEPESRIHTIQAHSGTLYTIGAISKDNTSGKSTKQNDLLVKAVDLSNLSTKWSRTFNFGNEQLPQVAAVTADKLIVGGCFGHVVVDTGSWVEFPDAFLAALDTTTGDLVGGKILHSDRKDIVLSIVPEGDRILFGGTADAPITHTADSDASQGYSKGFVRAISIDDLLKGEIKYGGQ